MKFLNWRNSNKTVPQLEGERGLTTRNKAGLPSIKGQFDTPPVPQPVVEPEKEPKKKSEWLNKLKKHWRYGFVLAAGVIGFVAWKAMTDETTSMSKNLVTGLTEQTDPEALKNGYLVHGAIQIIRQDAEGKADTTFGLLPDPKRVDLIDHESLDHRSDAERSPAENAHETPLSKEAAETLETVMCTPSAIVSERGWLAQSILGNQAHRTVFPSEKVAMSRNDKLEEYCNEGKVLSFWPVSSAEFKQYQNEVSRGQKPTWLPKGLGE